MKPTAEVGTIQRHRTALKRKDLSRPAKCALRDGLITAATPVFDYGCGHGGDVDLLGARGIACGGWNPVFFPDRPVQEADVVQLGYVINVIEEPRERAETLERSWRLCRRLLVVAAQVQVEARGQESLAFGDGELTGIGTFQKYFGQAELKAYLEEALGSEAIPAERGSSTSSRTRRPGSSSWPTATGTGPLPPGSGPPSYASTGTGNCSKGSWPRSPTWGGCPRPTSSRRPPPSSRSSGP